MYHFDKNWGKNSNFVEKEYFCPLMKKLLLFFAFFTYCFAFYAQEIEVGDADMEIITIKEWNILLSLNSSGFGLGFQHGKTPNANDKHLWEIEFLYRIHHKAVLGRTVLEGRAFQFGKLYDLFFFRGGYGYQRIITHKPYYGGVQIRYFFNFGATICLGLPTYLEIFTQAPSGPPTEIVRYDPNIHNLGDIRGAAPFFDRFHRIAVRPGFYGKAGFNFDFSNNPLKMQVLEAGLAMDMVFPFIQQMAFRKAQPVYFYGYVAYAFGRKKARYDF